MTNEGNNYEFEVACKVCGKTTWIYGTREDEDEYQDYTCLDCREDGS